MKTNSISAGRAVHTRTIATTRLLSFRRACLWTGFLAFATIAFEPPPAHAAVTEAWVQRYGSQAGSQDYASKVVTDAAGNVIVAGTTADNQASGGSDMLVIKYSGAGVPLWTNRYNGPGNSDDRATAVAVDVSGNVFVTESSGYSDVSGGNYFESATIAYSGAGVPLWTNRYNGPGNSSDQAIALAVDVSGNVFVTGSSGLFPGGDYATIAYSGAGVPLWTNRYAGRASALAVDASGNVFVTGWSGYFCVDTGCGGGDYATIAYSGAGVPLWTNRYAGQPSALAVDASGNVFVTGYSVASGGADYATIAYSGAGVPLWTNRYNGPENDQATAVAVDASGNVFVTGWSRWCDYGCDGDYYATIAYSSAGAPLCTNYYNGQPQTTPALAIGSDGAVYVTGASDADFVTVKYVWRPEIVIQLLSTIPPKVNLTLSGAPNSSWAIERALELSGPWTNLSALLIGTNGSAQFQDTNLPYPAGFYRARQ